MPIKLITITELRTGSYVIINDRPCIVRKIDISKTGKHGHAKARIEAVSLIEEKKYVIVKPGHEKIGVPLIEKKRAQVLSVDDKASIMDVESYETLSVDIPSSLKEEIKEGTQIEYWNVEGKLIIKRIIG